MCRVELYSASRDRGLELHFLDSRDFAPVGYERINKTTGKAVDWQHIVKGYEYEKGQYVALSDADFKHANVKASETIEIASFTNVADISPIFYQTPYYLLPGKGGGKVFRTAQRDLEGVTKGGRGHLRHARTRTFVRGYPGRARDDAGNAAFSGTKSCRPPNPPRPRAS